MYSNLSKRENSDCCVSVYMAAYNHEKYVRRAIESVLMQKANFKYEVIIHDDASTDATAKVIAEFAERFPNLVKPIFQTENQYSKGINIFLHFILPVVSGKYIAICECDDFWIDENKLQRQVDLLENHEEYSAVAHNCKFVNREENEIVTNYSRIYGPFRDHIHTIEYYYKYPDYYPGQSATLVFRSDVFLKLDFVEFKSYNMIRTNNDLKRNMMLLLHGNICCLEETMSSYRVVSHSSDSWTAKTIGKNLSGERFVAYRDLKRFAAEYYDINLKNYYVLFRTGFASAVKYAMNSTTENMLELNKAVNDTSGVFRFIVLIAFYGVLSIPTLLRKILRLDKQLLLSKSKARIL